ncbi:MAG: bifunctional methionine sulfoxide reductase B/A protein [Chlamydiales bacterium]
MFRYRKLTPEESEIILHQHTELAHSGSYNNSKALGIYACKQCDSPLYLSSKKFLSHCGWPSFEEEIPGAVENRPDPDGRRIEIICSHCNGHLGHVFIGENLTKANVRHCVNSLSMLFIPANTKEGFEIAFFAGGCFWGIESSFKTLQGVTSTSVGFMGGHVVDPTYKEVCMGKTGHLEAVKVVFDTQVLSYEDLAKFFFNNHDPLNQGVDQGEQYESCVFYVTEAQRDTIDSLIAILIKHGTRVRTKVRPASTFYLAEEEHQNYYEKHGHAPGCMRKNTLF